MRRRCDVSALTDPDVGTVGALAWAQLFARRNGEALCLCHCPQVLADMIDLLGLRDLLPMCALGVEVVGQTEQREHPGRVQKEADSRDPSI